MRFDMTDARQTPRTIRSKLRRRRRSAKVRKREPMQGRGITPQIEEELLLESRQTWMRLLRKLPAEDPEIGNPKIADVAPAEDPRENHVQRRFPKRAMG